MDLVCSCYGNHTDVVAKLRTREMFCEGVRDVRFAIDFGDSDAEKPMFDSYDAVPH